ncbi:MAG: type II 3-dehydroquinate dehydratase [Mariprofundaceae bacterium]|nr:type II 3-dehydroquinate dehydratase [Mariprofundaceae bacterium]
MMKRLHILVLNGPNLNLLGTREPGHYGAETLAEINRKLISLADNLGVELTTLQSNHEGELVEHIQKAGQDDIDAIVINPAAYTHTSVAIRDALLATRIPFVEVHLSNIHKREEFRHRSLLVDAAVGTVAGFGPASYTMALRGIIEHLKHKQGE